jgi:CDP-diacylglycerol--glycerol-3-phosphate 3-phosphatidyltransferase
VFLNKRTMEMAYWMIDPVIDFLAALRITPNMVTLFSLLPAAGAGVAIGFGLFGLASVLAVIATFCDIIDGLLARKTGVSSNAGEVIDAAVDRYGEFFLLGGLVYYYRTHDQVLFIVLAAIVGGFMVSYATAKAEAMGVAAPRGAMRRGERGSYLIFGAAFTPVTKTLFANSPSLAVHELPIILALSIIAVVSNISVLQRLGAVIEALRAKEKASAAAALEPAEPIGSKPDTSAGQL